MRQNTQATRKKRERKKRRTKSMLATKQKSMLPNTYRIRDDNAITQLRMVALDQADESINSNYSNRTKC